MTTVLRSAASFVLGSAFALLACGGSASSAPPASAQVEPPAATAASPDPPAPPAPAADGGAALTAAECKAAGGHVVGDIGNGAIHRPDYTCPGSGAKPVGPVRAEPGQPMAIEGSVCCR